MKRVVLDTNVVISALLFKGPSKALVHHWQSKTFFFLSSGTIMQEYARVLGYPKFHLTEPEIRQILDEEILPYIAPVTVKHVPRVIIEDPADDQFLACAVEGRADAMVSGDHHLLDLKRYRDIPIQTVREFLDSL